MLMQSTATQLLKPNIVDVRDSRKEYRKDSNRTSGPGIWAYARKRTAPCVAFVDAGVRGNGGGNRGRASRIYYSRRSTGGRDGDTLEPEGDSTFVCILDRNPFLR